MRTNKIKTLLLSQGYQPIRPISWKRAVVMQLLDKADVLETYDDCLVYESQNMKIYAPAVVRLRNFSKFEPIRLRFSRSNIYGRDSGKCQYCGNKFKVKDLTLDHVIPKSLGGETSWTNIVTACRECNSEKADKTPEQANMKLLSRPTYPSKKSLYKDYINKGENVPQEWQNWLFD